MNRIRLLPPKDCGQTVPAALNASMGFESREPAQATCARLLYSLLCQEVKLRSHPEHIPFSPKKTVVYGKDRPATDFPMAC